MPALPRATTSVQDQAGAAATGLDVICIWAPVAQSADMVPRMLGSAAAIYAQHGYSEGVEYAALHAERTRKPFMFCGLPIETPGAISRQDTSGNTNTSVASVVAGGDGVLAEHDGVIVVDTGGVIGTDQVKLLVSLDGGFTFKSVRLGTANSYTPPYINATVTFGNGSLTAGDTILTWHGSAPRSATSDWATARALLAAQQKGFRSILLCGDLRAESEAAAYLAQLNAYETENERFVYGRASVYDLPVASKLARLTVRMTGSPTLTFLEVGGTGDTITRGTGSWIADGFAVGDVVTVALSASNNVTGPIAALTATVLTFGTTDLANEGPVSGCTVVGSPGLTFAEVGASGDTITRSRGSWLVDGFRPGDKIRITGTVSNNITAAQGLAAVTDLVLTLGTDDLAAEVVASLGVSLTAGQTKAQWMAEVDAAFAPIDDAFRISLSAGRGRVLSPFSGWQRRTPAGWAASLREYQHDLHRATWRKSDGPSGFNLLDAEGNTVEWDDRVDGEAACAARFTALRSWANGPLGSFVALSLTRASEGSLLIHTSNVAVVNLICTTVQINTEDAAIGVDLDLNANGTATPDSLAAISKQVNNALSQAVLVNKMGEGKRASSCKWTPDADTLFNVASPVLTGVTDVLLKGIVHSVTTAVVVKTGG